MNILYSQCWEDPDLLDLGLGVTDGDDVLSIASAGDNSFALLLNHPRTLTAVDFNPAQLHLMELKMVATRLDHADFAAFLGARPCGSRVAVYQSLRNDLSTGARRFWDGRAAEIDRGVIHGGRLERYLASFRRWMFPLIHGPSLVRELLDASSLADQRRIYAERWDCRRWRWLFQLFFSRTVMSRCGRRPEWFAQVSRPNIAAALLERTCFGLTRVPTRGNYFLEYILTGGYRDLNTAPPYLRPANFKTLQGHVGRVTLRCSDLRGCLEQASPGAYSCFNLSDVFEYISPAETEATWRALVRAARPQSRVVYRTLFVPRPALRHPTIRNRAFSGPAPTRERDRTFFYDRFEALEIRKEEACTPTVWAC